MTPDPPVHDTRRATLPKSLPEAEVLVVHGKPKVVAVPVKQVKVLKVQKALDKVEKHPYLGKVATGHRNEQVVYPPVPLLQKVKPLPRRPMMQMKKQHVKKMRRPPLPMQQVRVKLVTDSLLPPKKPQP